MTPIKLNFKQSFKLYWSFIWRTWVLMIPFTIAIMVVGGGLVYLTGFHQTGTPAPALEFKEIAFLGLLYILTIALMIGMQALALKWAIEARWSDFKIVVYSTQDESNPTSTI